MGIRLIAVPTLQQMLEAVFDAPEGGLSLLLGFI